MKAQYNESLPTPVGPIDDTYHRTDVVRPDLVPVCGNFGASGNSGGELKGSRCAIVVASNGGISSIQNRVAKQAEDVTTMCLAKRS